MEMSGDGAAFRGDDDRRFDGGGAVRPQLRGEGLPAGPGERLLHGSVRGIDQECGKPQDPADEVRSLGFFFC